MGGERRTVVGYSRGVRFFPALDKQGRFPFPRLMANIHGSGWCRAVRPTHFSTTTQASTLRAMQIQRALRKLVSSVFQ